MLSPKKQKRSSRVRFKLKKNNKSRMRLTLYKSSQHLYAQIIDDNKGITVCSTSTLKSEKNKNSCNVANAKILGSERVQIIDVGFGNTLIEIITYI